MTKFITRKISIMLFSWLALVPATKAQFLCDVKAPAEASDTQRIFTALSCNGNNCTAALLVLVGFPVITEERLEFLRSNDGGFSWKTQDPGLPDVLAQSNLIKAIQQIDSLNVVAVGDTGLILRTFDGGVTWTKQKIPSSLTYMDDVSFANPMEGIALGADSTNNVFITTNGGQDWKLAAFSVPGLVQCHAYGNGKFQLFEYFNGNTYTTTDYWKTVDSTKPIVDPLANTSTRAKGFAYCRFGGGDTLIAYGNDLVGSPVTVFPLIARSTNGGVSWTTVFDDTDTSYHLGSVAAMSSIDRDTIIGGPNGGLDQIFISTDRGANWRVDTLLFGPTAEDEIASRGAGGCRGIGLNAEGGLIAAFGPFDSWLIYGTKGSLGIQTYEHIPYYSYLYPNPATQSVYVISQDQRHPIRVYDILGREVLRGELDQSGKCKLDVSTLPSGMYIVMLDHDGAFLPVSSVAVMGH